MTPLSILGANPIVTEEFERPTTKLFVWDCLGGSFTIPGTGIETCANRVLVLLLLALFTVMLLFLLAFRKPKIVPGKFQVMMEGGVEFIREQIVMQMIGAEGMRYLPYLTALFFFIFLGNILAVIPGINFPVNSRVAFPMVLAVISWVVYNYAGVRAQGFVGYMKSVLFPPGAPAWVYVFLTPIEFITTILVRPVTLTIRLTANMFAGHLLLSLFFLGTAALLGSAVTAVFAVFSLGLSITLVGFEIFVSALQAFIFTVLTASYIAGAVHPEH